MSRTGKRIREVLRMIEKRGTATTADLRKAFPKIPSSNLCGYCTEAESYGWLTIDRTVYPRVYATVKGWRTATEKSHQRQSAPAPVSVFRRGMVNSVFAMGQQ